MHQTSKLYSRHIEPVNSKNNFLRYDAVLIYTMTLSEMEETTASFSMLKICLTKIDLKDNI